MDDDAGENEESSLKQLDKKISQQKEIIAERERTPKKNDNMASRMVSELLAGTAVGCFIGYGLDALLDTKPIFFLICFFLGVAAGGLNIYKLAIKNSGADDVS